MVKKLLFLLLAGISFAQVHGMDDVMTEGERRAAEEKLQSVAAEIKRMAWEIESDEEYYQAFDNFFYDQVAQLSGGELFLRFRMDKNETSMSYHIERWKQVAQNEKDSKDDVQRRKAEVAYQRLSEIEKAWSNNSTFSLGSKESDNAKLVSLIRQMRWMTMPDIDDARYRIALGLLKLRLDGLSKSEHCLKFTDVSFSWEEKGPTTLIGYVGLLKHEEYRYTLEPGFEKHKISYDRCIEIENQLKSYGFDEALTVPNKPIGKQYALVNRIPDVINRSSDEEFTAFINDELPELARGVDSDELFCCCRGTKKEVTSLRAFFTEGKAEITEVLSSKDTEEVDECRRGLDRLEQIERAFSPVKNVSDKTSNGAPRIGLKVVVVAGVLALAGVVTYFLVNRFGKAPTTKPVGGR